MKWYAQYNGNIKLTKENLSDYQNKNLITKKKY